MKINRLETHDRLQYLIKDQSEKVQKGAEDCLKKNPLSLAYQEKSHYIYIFGHARTHDNGVDKVLYWQPRLTKPNPESNSYLFRAKSHSDIMELCWILPPHEVWGQYKDGNMVNTNDIAWSIHQFKYNKKLLSKPFPDDFPKEKCDAILLQIAKEMEQNIAMKKGITPRILET